MKPLRLTAENYRSFRELELDLPHGVCAIVGQNGAGKSSVVNVIDIALFGPESRSLEHYLADDAEGGDLTLTLEFEHAGEMYRVRRGFRSRGRGSSSLDFEIHADEERDTHALERWEPLTRESTAATQVVIEQTIGLTRQTFRASAFLAQGDGAAFTDAQPKDRKAILAEVLGLDVWDRLLAMAHGDRAAKQAALQEVAGEMAAHERLVDEKPRVAELLAACADVERNARADLNLREVELAEAQVALRQAEQHADRRRAADAELARAQGEHDRLRAVKVAADQAAEERKTVAAQLAALTSEEQLASLVAEERAAEDRLAEIRAAVAAHDAAQREHDLRVSQREAIAGQANDHRAKAVELRQKASALEAAGPGHSTCERCHQTLGAEALASSLATMRVQADELDATAKDLDAQAAGIALPVVPAAPANEAAAAERLNLAREALRKAQEDQAARARLEERIRTLDAAIRDAANDDFANALAAAAQAVQTAEAALTELGTAPADVAGATATVETCRRHVEQERQRLQTALTEKAKAETLQAQILDAEQKLAAGRERTAAIQAEIDLLADLERAYGRDGIPALIVESQAVPHIETEANRILAELGTPYRVELHTQRALKSGDGLRDTLDVLVVADSGARPYETFSGGERTRINLALRIALARLLANRRGAESRLLCIDEPEFLDEDGVARLAEVLRGLSSDFDSVYLISHVPSLRDSFDTTLEVVKGDGGSTVRIAA